MKNSIKAKKLEVSGVVQGVGFRPFLFQLAHKYKFTGEVLNTFQGVSLVIEGLEGDMDAFCKDIYEKSPPLACVVDIKSQDIPLKNYKKFAIVTSTNKNRIKSALIPPDTSVCRDCLDEMRDPENRRFKYPFINCTNCGPRYTIIKDIPYDRSETSMACFKMCSECSREYNNPGDRRFHAQPNACPVCGPHAFLVDNKGKKVELNGKTPVEAAAGLLCKGKIVAVKGLGGFHLAADAFNDHAVKRLRLFKNRPHKPFGLMAASVASALDYVVISKDEKAMLESNARPIVLLEKKKSKNITQKKRLSTELAPLNRYLGIMLPYTPLHYLLFDNGLKILVMTSGNPTGEPLCIDNNDAFSALKNTADYFLFHNRDIYFRADDSIVSFQHKARRFLRRSRGYAPLPVFLKNSMPSILACGGGLKSTICLTKENRAFLSQHIGDLDNQKIFEFYKKSIEHLKLILDIEPDIIVHDLHPGYMSTSYAEEQTFKGHISKNHTSKDNISRDHTQKEHIYIKKIAVQHHHAHAVSCMAENKISGPVIAVTLDGTGLGTDGKIWGGEVLVCTETSFQRMAHLCYVPMPGSEAAVFEPWRMGAAYLYHAFGKNFIDLDIPFIKTCGKDKLKFILTMMEKKINSPMTSSCGRLFDAVSALLGIRTKISFESQAAMELETMAAESSLSGINGENINPLNTDGAEYSNKSAYNNEQSYNFEFKTNNNSHLDLYENYGTQGNECFHDKLESEGTMKSHCMMESHVIVEIDFSLAVRQIVDDLQSNIPVISNISKKFHNTVVSAFTDAVMYAGRKTGIKEAVLSGGVFNNSIILNGICSALEKRDIKAYTHSKVPTGDGGISLGQAVIAGMREKRGKKEAINGIKIY